MSHEAGATTFVRSPEYSERLYNEDLAPLRPQTWSSYNIFAFWMSDVHSVGGYVFAGSLFALGLNAWQVLIALLLGIGLVNVFANLIARPSQQAGVPYPVICRMTFGVFGANIPAIIRGLIAVAWYGIQTYLASAAFTVVLLRFFPGLKSLNDTHFLGLSLLGWTGFMVMWVLQALVFWFGMNAIRRFIDFAGPAVYVVMIALAVWMVSRVGWSHINFNLADVKFSGSAAIFPFVTAVALVVSYFSGPMLNFGDFSRYGKTFGAVKQGNFWGLPVNFLVFSILTVITTSATLPLFHEVITDPIAMVSRIDNTTAVVLGALTFMLATIGINIVANFVSPAFDFSNVAPNRISWRTGGFIAAVAAIFITPWNLYNSPAVIHFTLDTLASFIGPLFGIILLDFYLVKRGQIHLDSLYIANADSRYWYQNGVNRAAVWALVPAVLVGLAITFLPGLSGLANFAWFIGVTLGAVFYYFTSAAERASSVQVGVQPIIGD
ncbi:NCS1 family nucleobase:cation symporter-1 [Deinococcus ruber]|uniref:Transport-related membrane protein n=1 Tax=Deinococcus ruber TaxID=1848197 RepID=A0A918CCS8_9DEIO|nr:NCS1 family nucleobase:cation symporter-1 [Deinococcus ruber]GGR14247.1 transport-related membrane protein [Deinococcus ruber]